MSSKIFYINGLKKSPKKEKIVFYFMHSISLKLEKNTSYNIMSRIEQLTMPSMITLRNNNALKHYFHGSTTMHVLHMVSLCISIFIYFD
jgi:hypothetical protein